MCQSPLCRQHSVTWFDDKKRTFSYVCDNCFTRKRIAWAREASNLAPSEPAFARAARKR
jgi:hypothetical protein